jgi:hypothetical protein
VFRSFTNERRPRIDVKLRAQIFEPDALSEDPVASLHKPTSGRARGDYTRKTQATYEIHYARILARARGDCGSQLRRVITIKRGFGLRKPSDALISASYVDPKLVSINQWTWYRPINATGHP